LRSCCLVQTAVGCDRDVHDSPSLVREDDEHEEQPERNRWYHEVVEEIGAGDGDRTRDIKLGKLE